ncbi:MAG: family 43 glycosylhydrolase [Clostridia bacterium]|nr:family 43 glycosylhydrolase [Clostridia bacterium]
MNPILPRNFFMADGEAHVYGGRLYLVGSTDISGNKNYCSGEYHIWSTDDPKLVNWVDHGAVFRHTHDDPSISWAPNALLYAPDIAFKNGRYYLYICGSNCFEAVASSEKIEGPYGDVRKINRADGDSIDPTVFVDDDGQAYYLWGQFHLRGAKLKDNMSEIDESTLTDNVLTEQKHGFHEGASLRKINGKYYIVYTDISRGRATCMSYAVSDKPLGPYKKGGVIIDNTGCDPQTWNNHGSIQSFCGKWFVFYHRSSQNSRTSRRMCAEPIEILLDGSIPEVKMTSHGADDEINAFCEVDASLACRMMGDLYIVPDNERPGFELLKICGSGSRAEAWAEYRAVDFGAGAKTISVKAMGCGEVILMTERDGRIASICFDSDKNETKTAELKVKPKGKQIVWLLFKSREMDVFSFSFGT